MDSVDRTVGMTSVVTVGESEFVEHDREWNVLFLWELDTNSRKYLSGWRASERSDVPSAWEPVAATTTDFVGEAWFRQ